MSVLLGLRFWIGLARTVLCIFLFCLIVGLATALPPTEPGEYVNSRRFRIGVVVANVGAVGILVGSLLIYRWDVPS